MTENAIVTGGTGFLGRNLIRRLCADGTQVYAVVRPDSRNMDKLPHHPNVIPVICSVEEIGKAKKEMPETCDTFYHFAWSGVNRKELDDDIIQEKNVSDSVAALEVAADLGCKAFLFAGSRSEYGKQNGYYSENLPCHPQVAYGRAKLAFLDKATAFCGQQGISYLHPRIFSVYGPDDHPWSLIYSSVRKMLDNEPIDLSECTQMWNFMDIEDATDLMVTMVRDREKIPEGTSPVFNVANRDIRPLREFVEEMYALTGSKSQLNFGAFHQAAESAIHLMPDMTKVETIFGWTYRVSFREGILKLIRSMEENHA